ncbi:odorant receptor 10-like [Anoplolepis gracilipes]|uniref:odorant receptor 10-like n=1 Tax=Anoplolepis gracilipes TaxID=354296 RepID=UPI003B9E7A57
MDISESSGYRDYLWAIELNRRSLELIGLWPNIDGIKRRLGPDIRVGFAFIMITFVLGIPLVHALTRVWGDIALTVDNLRLTLPLLTISLKLVIMRWKQSVLLSVINMIREDWMTFMQDTERNVMMKRVRTSRLIVFCVYFVSIFTVIVMSIFPYYGLMFRSITNLTDRDKPLPLQTYYIYNTDKSLQFELTYLTQVIVLCLSLMVTGAVDTFFGFLILHICGQLENFRHRLVNLIADREFNKILKYYIVTHLRLIRYINNIENIFTLMMFGWVLYFGIIFCLAGFVFILMINNMKVNATNVLQIYYMIIAIITFFTQMFFYCYAGELITEQCEAVYRAVCDLKWYKWESKQARDFIILMIRVQKPFHITAGKIVPLTMSTFCSLVKTSAGYISFLLAIQD